MKKFSHKTTYYKVTNDAEKHNGLRYKTGHNVDPLPFDDDPTRSCVKGGIYFTDLENILKFGDYGCWIRPVTIPKGVKVITDPEGDKFRAHEVILGERIHINDFVKDYKFTKDVGYVYLRSLTALPEGTQFNNGGDVDLPSLTALPEGTQFNNGGYVYLRSLTALPEGTQFNNGGYVDLRSLTALPEGTQFNNGGYVDLRSLTALPEGTQFNNGGYVYLRSLTAAEKEKARKNHPKVKFIF